MFGSGAGMLALTAATAAVTVVAAIATSAATARWWTAGATTTLTTRTTALASALSVPLITSRNERSTAAVRHMKAVSRNGQYCCCAEREIFYIEVYMKAVYVEEDSILKYFIFGIDEKKDEIDSEEYQFENIEIIKSKAFQNQWNIKRVLFDEKLKTIEKEAFKDCSKLEVFCCCQVSNLQKRNRES